MKFLEYTPLSRMNVFLSSVNLGDRLLKGTLEAYSCKVAGIDKKLSRSLEQEVLDSLAASPRELSVSPVGPLSSLASRRTLIHLILTLSHMYPDYDFSGTQPHQFHKEGLNAAKLRIENYLLEINKVWAAEYGEEHPFFDCLWFAIDEVIELDDCDVYSFMPDTEGYPFTEGGTIWSFNYFLYNWKLKRTVYLSCHCLSKLAMDEYFMEEIVSDKDQDLIFHGMDMEE